MWAGYGSACPSPVRNAILSPAETLEGESEMRLLTAAVISVALAATVAMQAAPVMAATSAPARTAVQETRGVGKTYMGTFSGDWTHCTYVTKATYTQTANCASGRAVSETVSGHAGFSIGAINSAVGFSVTYTTVVSSSN